MSSPDWFRDSPEAPSRSCWKNFSGSASTSCGGRRDRVGYGGRGCLDGLSELLDGFEEPGRRALRSHRTLLFARARLTTTVVTVAATAIAARTSMAAIVADRCGAAAIAQRSAQEYGSTEWAHRPANVPLHRPGQAVTRILFGLPVHGFPADRVQRLRNSRRVP